MTLLWPPSPRPPQVDSEFSQGRHSQMLGRRCVVGPDAVAGTEALVGCPAAVWDPLGGRLLQQESRKTSMLPDLGGNLVEKGRTPSSCLLTN